MRNGVRDMETADMREVIRTLRAWHKTTLEVLESAMSHLSILQLYVHRPRLFLQCLYLWTDAAKVSLERAQHLLHSLTTSHPVTSTTNQPPHNNTSKMVSHDWICLCRRAMCWLSLMSFNTSQGQACTTVWTQCLAGTWHTNFVSRRVFLRIKHFTENWSVPQKVVWKIFSTCDKLIQPYLECQYST